MASTRLYRSAIASASGVVGEALTRQLLVSPICSEVRTLGAVNRREFEGLANRAKLHDLGGILDLPPQKPTATPDSGESGRFGSGPGGEGLSSVYAAFFVVGSGRWSTPARLDEAKAFAERCAEAKVPHVTLLSSMWADGMMPSEGAKIQGEIQEAFKSVNQGRLSIFKPSLILPTGAAASALDDAELPERCFNTVFPTARSFLPTSYREVTLDDLVLAMRLNVELVACQDPIEELTFADMMAIIGKESTV